MTSDIKKHMEKTLEHLKVEFSKMRVGRANPSMLEGVKVDVYGSQMGIKEVAALSVPDAKTITITPWDRGVIAEVEKAILAANLGITPMNDGKMIRINLPPLTEDRRKDFVKQLKKQGEDAKVSIRNVRRDGNDKLKSQKDAGEISEDDVRRFQDEIQKMTDHYIADIDKTVEGKSKEIMSL